MSPKKIGIAIGGTVIGLGLFWWQMPNLLGLFYPDSAAVGDADLRYTVAPVADGDNLYVALKAAGALVKTDQAAALSAWESAAAKMAYYNPAFATVLNSRTEAEPPMLTMDNDIRQVAELSAAHALAEDQAGHADAALDEAGRLVTIGTTILKSRQDGLALLYGTIIAKLGLDTMGQLVDRREASAGALARARQVVVAAQVDRTDVLSHLAMAHYASVSRSIIYSSARDADPEQRSSYGFRMNRTVALLAAAVHAQLREIVPKPCGEYVAMTEPQPFYFDYKPLYRFLPNIYGELLVQPNTGRYALVKLSEAVCANEGLRQILVGKLNSGE